MKSLTFLENGNSDATVTAILEVSIHKMFNPPELNNVSY